jgi:hypothetical protein
MHKYLVGERNSVPRSTYPKADTVRRSAVVGSVAKLVHNCAGYGIQMVLAEVFSMGIAIRRTMTDQSAGDANMPPPAVNTVAAVPKPSALCHIRKCSLG